MIYIENTTVRTEKSADYLGNAGENVRGFLDPIFEAYRASLKARLASMGYSVDWRLFQSSDFGVPQLRPRVAIVAARSDYWKNFRFPTPHTDEPKKVGEVLADLMSANGWPHSDKWAKAANEIAPTIVGGSKKHGGPDLGPTRARKAWEKLGVNGSTIAETAPLADHIGLPRLTTRMVARLQGFPDDWHFVGKKTNAYRQIGNAFPPPVAEALGRCIREAIFLTESDQSDQIIRAAE